MEAEGFFPTLFFSCTSNLQLYHQNENSILCNLRLLHSEDSKTMHSTEKQQQQTPPLNVLIKKWKLTMPPWKICWDIRNHKYDNVNGSKNSSEIKDSFRKLLLANIWIRTRVLSKWPITLQHGVVTALGEKDSFLQVAERAHTASQLPTCTLHTNQEHQQADTSQPLSW